MSRLREGGAHREGLSEAAWGAAAGLAASAVSRGWGGGGVAVATSLMGGAAAACPTHMW